MNIFILSVIVSECARYHCDKHVVKMILESTQLLWSAFHLTLSLQEIDIPSNIKVYRLTHKNHPMAIWTRKNLNNFKFLLDLALELCKEYNFRYGKQHACYSTLIWMREFISKLAADSGFCKSPDNYKIDQRFGLLDVPSQCTPIPLCMPQIYYRLSVVESYRAYYNGDKQHILKWTNRDVPDWIIKHISMPIKLRIHKSQRA